MGVRDDAGAETDVLTFQEALRFLRVSRNTLYAHAKAGTIPGARRVGKQWRFSRKKLRSWLEVVDGRE